MQKWNTLLLYSPSNKGLWGLSSGLLSGLWIPTFRSSGCPQPKAFSKIFLRLDLSMKSFLFLFFFVFSTFCPSSSDSLSSSYPSSLTPYSSMWWLDISSLFSLFFSFVLIVCSARRGKFWILQGAPRESSNLDSFWYFLDKILINLLKMIDITLCMYVIYCHWLKTIYHKI